MRFACASTRSPPARTRTTSPRRATGRSGTRLREQASSAGSIPPLARQRKYRSASGSAPHGVIVGPDGAAWVTDGGLNAIVRVDSKTDAVTRFPLPASSGGANLNTATFDRRGVLWFTGQSGIYGRLDPRTGAMRVFRAPLGAGPYGIATTPKGQVWYASLAGSHVAQINVRTGKATVFRPPTRDQGARRIWSDSRGRLWVSEWDAGKVARYDPIARRWREWRLPGAAQPYAVYVDGKDIVWLTDFGAGAIVRFDPKTAALHAPAPTTRRRRPPTARTAGRGLGRRVGHGPARRRARLIPPTGCRPVQGLPWPGMEERLRPLSERECYERLYGERNPLVTVLPAGTAPPPWPSLSAERMRQAFLDRMDLRDPLDDVEEAA